MTSTMPQFKISRKFSFSLDINWQCWTNKEHYKNWFGPKGGKYLFDKGDFKALECHYYTMEFNGTIMHGMQFMWEKVEKQKLVWQQCFANQDFTLAIKHPMADKWPTWMHTEVLFTGDNKSSKIDLTWTPLMANAEELAVFSGAIPSMQGGWGGSFEVLEEYGKDLKKIC